MSINDILSLVLHLDRHLNELINSVGAVWMYVILFTIIFCETGLVVVPFLPGDSLLFAVGAMCAIDGSPLSLVVMVPLLIVAAVLGDALNYWLGALAGPRVFSSESSRWFNKRHLLRAQEFYAKYGAKTIIIARFVPIVRTFAPFVAGIGKMNFLQFWIYNIVGGILLGYDFLDRWILVWKSRNSQKVLFIGNRWNHRCKRDSCSARMAQARREKQQSS